MSDNGCSCRLLSNPKLLVNRVGTKECSVHLTPPKTLLTESVVEVQFMLDDHPMCQRRSTVENTDA